MRAGQDLTDLTTGVDLVLDALKGVARQLDDNHELRTTDFPCSKCRVSEQLARG